MDLAEIKVNWSQEPPSDAKTDIDKLVAEVERLSELLWGARCIFCGNRTIGRDKKNQDISDEVLREHIEVCPEHPLGKARAKVERLRALLGEARELVRCVPDHPWQAEARAALGDE